MGINFQIKECKIQGENNNLALCGLEGHISHEKGTLKDPLGGSKEPSGSDYSTAGTKVDNLAELSWKEFWANETARIIDCHPVRFFLII